MIDFITELNLLDSAKSKLSPDVFTEDELAVLAEAIERLQRYCIIQMSHF